tara:strand:- start:770 stop:988 length:219 start_codon:yes stop_codon:yes gene_type:complete
MKLIDLILRQFKTFLPYFLLIALYFFFINLEIKQKKKNESTINIDRQLNKENSVLDDKQQLRISIPVVPYRK